MSVQRGWWGGDAWYSRDRAAWWMDWHWTNPPDLISDGWERAAAVIRFLPPPVRRHYLLSRSLPESNVTFACPGHSFTPAAPALFCRCSDIFHPGSCVSSLSMDLHLRRKNFYISKNRRSKRKRTWAWPFHMSHKRKKNTRQSEEMVFGLFTMRHSKPAVCLMLLHGSRLMWSSAVFPRGVSQEHLCSPGG